MIDFAQFYKPTLAIALKKVHFIYLLVLLVSGYSCKKDEIITHEQLIVPGNQIPPYNGIPSILVENYVNKIYIDLIGLKPTVEEKDAGVKYLVDNELSTDAREKIISDVINNQAYHDRLFQISTDLLLNGMGYDEIEGVVVEYTAIRDFFLQSGDTFQARVVENEVLKVQLVLEASGDYKNSDISLNEYYSRLSFNLIYDEINMGSENFVISCFENLFKRNPTASEDSNGVDMVDGSSTTILRKEGRTKVDFLKIVTEDPEFYQGRVLDAYQTLLLRLPNSVELSEASTKYLTSGDYKQVQIDIVKTDEYAGFL